MISGGSLFIMRFVKAFYKMFLWLTDKKRNVI